MLSVINVICSKYNPKSSQLSHKRQLYARSLTNGILLDICEGHILGHVAVATQQQTIEPYDTASMEYSGRKDSRYPLHPFHKKNNMKQFKSNLQHLIQYIFLLFIWRLIFYHFILLLYRSLYFIMDQVFILNHRILQQYIYCGNKL